MHQREPVRALVKQFYTLGITLLVEWFLSSSSSWTVFVLTAAALVEENRLLGDIVEDLRRGAASVAVGAGSPQLRDGGSTP